MLATAELLGLISLLLLTWSNLLMWDQVCNRTPPNEKDIRKKVEGWTRNQFYKTYEEVDHNLGAENLGRLVQLINKSQLKVEK
jgi:hypothetical protein